MTAGGGFETPVSWLVSWPFARAGEAASAMAAAVRIIFMRTVLLSAFERKLTRELDSPRE
jgi:hypothetical protein